MKGLEQGGSKGGECEILEKSINMGKVEKHHNSDDDRKSK